MSEGQRRDVNERERTTVAVAWWPWASLTGAMKLFQASFALLLWFTMRENES